MLECLWALLTAPFIIVLLVLIASAIGAAWYYDRIED